MACFGADRRCRVLGVLVALLTGGCVRPRAEVRDSLEARVLPASRAVPKPAPDERIGRCGFIGRLVICRTHAMQRDGRREHEHETR